MRDHDIVYDILHRVTTLIDIPFDILTRIETEARLHWGGETVYVQKDVQRGILAQRDALIHKDHVLGISIKLLAQRHSLTERRIQQIVCRRNSQR